MMKQCYSALLAAIALAAMASSAQAAVITSGTFDLGFGYTANSVWDTTETAGSNTAVTGPFTITVTPTSSNFVNPGPTFPGRVLTDGTNNFSGSSNSDLFTVTATYTGGEPGLGATPLTLVIDSISIYGFNLVNFTNLPGSPDTINWSETTAGNIGASPTQDLGATAGFGAPSNLAANYDQLSWNPGDVAVAGISSTRTFTVDTNLSGGAGLDGFEIVGRIEFDADVIPEPSALVLTGFGLIGLFGYGRRRKG